MMTTGDLVYWLNNLSLKSNFLNQLFVGFDFWILLVMGLLIVTIVLTQDFNGKGFHRVLLFLLSLSISWGLVFILKSMLDWSRPYEIIEGVVDLVGAIGSSMPSGHASVFSVMGYFSVLYVRNRYVKTLLIVLVVLGLVSRMAVGAHFLQDIVIGAIIGVLVIRMIILSKERIFQLISENKTRRNLER